MYSIHSLRKKRIIIIIFGLILSGVFIAGFVFLRDDPRDALSFYLPAEDTVIYAALPHTLHSHAVNVIQRISGVDIQVPHLDELADSLALVRLRDPIRDSDVTFIAMQPHSNEAEQEIRNYFSEPRYAIITGPAEWLIITANSKKVDYIQKVLQNIHAVSLYKNSAFMSALNRDTSYPYFLFAQPKLSSDFFSLPLEIRTPIIPLNSIFTSSIEGHFEVNDTGIRGLFISPQDEVTPIDHSVKTEREKPYRALTLDVLPIDPDVFVGGASARRLIEKNSLLTENVIHRIMQKYLPGLSYIKDIAPLLEGEFGLVTQKRPTHTAALVAIHIDHASITMPAPLYENILHSLQKGLQSFAYTAQPFTLKDGTEAFEKIPNPEGVTLIQEDIGNAKLWSINYGNYDSETPQALYMAISGNTWFMSNDRELISKSLELAASPGLNLRIGEMYRAGLQSIIKNPEIAGVIHIQFDTKLKGLWSFSKRIFDTYSETQFAFMLE